jgi:hypothetical protein
MIVTQILPFLSVGTNTLLSMAVMDNLDFPARDDR